MLDVSSTDQQDLLSPNNGTPARSVEPSAGEAFAASWEAAQRLDGYDAEYQNQRDFAQQRFDGFTAKTGVAIPPQTSTADPGIPTIDTSYQDWLTGARAIMQREAASRNDPTLLPPSDEDIATGGLALARGAVRRQAQLSQGPITLGSIAGSTAAGAASSTIDPLNALSLALAPEGGPLLATALRMGGAMAGQQLLGDVARFGYRQQVDPSYGVGDVAKDVLEAGAGGALFGAGHVLGGEGVRGALGAAAGGALGGGVLGAIGGGLPGAIEGAAGGAALPLAGAGLGLSARSLGMSWRAFKARSPDAAASMPLEVRDAGEVAEKAGDLMAQSTFRGASGEAAHAEAIDATEKALFVGQPVELPASAEAEAAARRGTVFFPGGSIDARYDVAEHSDLIASHDADFRVNPAYPPELQPRDRSGAPAQDQVNSIAANLEPDRLGPSPEANSGAPIVGPDGIVESGNGRTLAIGRAYDLGRAGPYRAWLERQGFDTTGMDRPVLVGMRETPLDAGQRADFAHAANGSASLRMSATEQAMSDARLIDGSTLDLAKSPDLTAAANRDLARAFVAKLPEGERGGLLKLDGGMSANGAQRMRAALTARAYGDPAFLSRTFDHLDGNIKAIGGAMADAAPAWARMRDATTRGDIAPGHDITRDLLQAVHAVMRARDEGRPPWEVLNQGDMFQSDTTQLAARMFFRDEEMRQPAGRKAIADALTSYAEEAAKNTLHGRLFDDAVPPADVLRRMGAAAVEKIESLFDTAVRDVSAVGRPGRLASNPMEATAFRARWDGLDRDAVLPMFGGERAAGADLGALERAKQLEAQKVGPAKIHAETGWFKRADGWRFEIDDSKVKFKDDAFRSPDDEDDDGGDFSFGGDGLFGRRGEMSGGGAATTYSGRLGDLVDAPDLFHAYPQLAGVDIRIGRSGSTSLGSFDPAKGRIEVDGSADKPQILSTLLHEIQHAVQLEEGFSAGGNSETLARRTQAALFDVSRQIEGQRPGSNIRADLIKMRSTLRDQAEHLAGGSIFGMTTEQADGYQRLVGEVEARNTQTRQAMTEAERRAALPTSTEDVPASEQYRAEDLVDLRHKNGAATDALVARELAKVRNTTERSGLTHTDDPIRLSLSDIEGARSSINASMKLTPKEVSRAVKLYGTDAISRKLDDLIVRAKPRGMRAVLLPEVKEMLAKIAEENPELRKPSPYRPVAIDREGLIEDYGGPTYTQDDLDKVSGQITEAMEAMGGSGKLDAQEASFMVSDFASQGIGNEFGIDRMHPEAFEKFAANHSQLVDEYRRALDYLQYAQNKGAGLARSINVLGRGRAVDSGERRSQAGENAPNLALRNPRTGEPVQAQAVASLKDMLGRFSPVRDPNADPLARASALAIGSRLGKLVGDTPVFTVGPAEMRTLIEGRMRLQPGYEPAGFYDPRSGHIVALDDALRDPREAGQLMLHEGTHGFTMRAIEESPAARDLIDTIRQAAIDAHQAAGGDSADHYGLTNAHEFVAEGFSAPEFQRFLASIPASDAIVKAFDLDGPGHSLWDVLVAAVRKILGLAPDQHTLLDATMRLGKILEDERADLLRAEDEHIAGLPKEISHAVDGGAAQDSLEAAARSGGESPATTAGDAAGASADGRPVGGGSGGAAGDIGTAGVGAAVGSSPGDAAGLDDLKPILRFAEAERREDAAKIAAARAKAFADAKSAIAYRINSDRIEQHPKGPLAGFLGILTRDIHEKGGINVEAVQQVYQDRIGAIAEKLTEAYGSKWAGLKQDVAGMRDVIREVFGVDTKNQTAKAVGEAWRAADTYATGEAKRLGKVFTPAEDWRVPQFWESSRAQKFGKGALLADLDREITSGGLRVFDPDTHEEANPLRLRAILDGVADKIVTDASLGGTHGGAFKTDMRVFRFADGAAGADSYLRLMDKYGAGRGGYLAMMQAHIGKVSRELGLARVLGPNWSEVGEKLLQDAQLANKKIVANTPPRDAMQRVKDLPKDTGKFLTSWLESPAKADAVWQHMSGQASGVGSELMAGLLAETRSFMTATRMGSALVTAVPADSVNFMMAAKHNGMDMGRLVSGVAQAFVHDTPELREEAARLGIATHSGMDAALGTKRFEDQFVGEKVFKRMAETVIRLQGLHAWDSAIKRVFVQEFLGTIAQRAGKAFEDLDEPFANFVDRYGLKGDWQELSDPAHMLDTGEAKYLHPDNLPEALRVKLMSAIYDERQFAYLAGGSERVRATSASAKAGTLPGELARSVFLFKSFPMTMLSTWGMRAAREAGAGRIGTLATLVTGMTFAGALAMQARSILQGKDPRKMDDPYFWAESFLQGGAAGIYGDFFKEAFSRSDTSLTESLMGPLAAIPAGIQGLTSGARRAAEDGEHVNFGGKVARLLSQNVPGGNLWYARLGVSRLIMDNIQRMIDPDYNRSFARQQQRALKTNQQGFYWAPGQNTPSRAPDLGASLQ